MRNTVSTKIENQEDIKRAVTTSDDQQLNKFCPLINKKCRKDCMCFGPAEYNKMAETLIHSRCANPMVNGKINVTGTVATY